MTTMVFDFEGGDTGGPKGGSDVGAVSDDSHRAATMEELKRAIREAIREASEASDLRTRLRFEAGELRAERRFEALEEMLSSLGAAEVKGAM